MTDSLRWEVRGSDGEWIADPDYRRVDPVQGRAELATLVGHDGHSITTVTFDLITCSCGVTWPTADFITSDGLEPSR